VFQSSLLALEPMLACHLADPSTITRKLAAGVLRSANLGTVRTLSTAPVILIFCSPVERQSRGLRTGHGIGHRDCGHVAVRSVAACDHDVLICQPKTPDPTIAIEPAIAGRPSHGSVRAELPHTALTLDAND
jgi:hypothetical protein